MKERQTMLPESIETVHGLEKNPINQILLGQQNLDEFGRSDKVVFQSYQTVFEIHPQEKALQVHVRELVDCVVLKVSMVLDVKLREVGNDIQQMGDFLCIV